MQGMKLNGGLNLSKIPQELIRQNKNGESVIYIDVIENKNGADRYGNTHTITLYNRDTKETIYLANLKPQNFGAPQGQAPAQGFTPAYPVQAPQAPQGYAPQAPQPQQGYYQPQAQRPAPQYQPQGYAPQAPVKKSPLFDENGNLIEDMPA